MRSWLFAGLLGLSCSVFAQQTTNTPPAASSPSSGSSTNTSPTKTSPGSTNPPSADDLSRDLTFPGDKPANAPAAPAPAPKAPDLTPPRSDRVRVDDLGDVTGQSSSKDTQTDLDAPADDATVHPKSSSAVAATEASTSGGNSGVTEFRVWDPHKAAKSVEVGDFYFKRKNYRAAEDRYREALTYKENDAVATFRLAICLEKLELPNDARQEYESYLKILPHGPEAEQARKAIERLKALDAGATTP